MDESLKDLAESGVDSVGLALVLREGVEFRGCRVRV